MTRTIPRKHALELAYPDLWRAIDGALRMAQHAHDDIVIPERRRSSVVKRCVGQVLASARSGKPDDTVAGALRTPQHV